MNKYTDPDFSSLALITIDTQVDFLDGQAFEIPGTTAVLPAMQRLLTAFREQERPIVHIVRLYPQDGQKVELCRRALIESGVSIARPHSPGSQLAFELRPASDVKLDPDLLLNGLVQSIGPNEVLIYKPRWGAFFQTPLEEHLRGQNLSTLVFCGCNYPNCPRTSIYEASERDFKLILVVDAISGLYEKGAEEMVNIGVNLITTEGLLDRLQPGE